MHVEQGGISIGDSAILKFTLHSTLQRRFNFCPFNNSSVMQTPFLNSTCVCTE